MQVCELAIAGAFEFTPDIHTDQRGLFVAPYQEGEFVAAVGHSFSAAQLNYSRSARGVIRGPHFTRTPPGQSKYVYCAGLAAFTTAPRDRLPDATTQVNIVARLGGALGAALFTTVLAHAMAGGTAHAFTVAFTWQCGAAVAALATALLLWLVQARLPKERRHAAPAHG